MANFNFKALSVSSERTARYTIHEIQGAPALHLLPATEANKPYLNAVLRRAQHSRARKGVTAALLDELRDGNRAMFAEHVLRGWDGVVDEDGRPVPFSQPDALAFLRAIPDHLFDGVKAFAEDPSNFTAEALDAEAAAKK